jgi:hypothetical protein
LKRCIHGNIEINLKLILKDLLFSIISSQSLSENEILNKLEESWDVLARRHLLDEEDILKKCTESGQVAGDLSYLYFIYRIVDFKISLKKYIKISQ